MHNNKDHITICICTYRRNKMLATLLQKINNQETSDAFSFSIVIIDNDSSGHAKGIVFDLMDKLGINIQYEIETNKSIPAARNHAIRLAKGNYIAFIDDDEFPTQNWLISLYNAIQLFDVDGALGPVIPFFENRPPKWLLDGKFFERPIFRTGKLLKWNETRTGNVLIKREVFDEYGLLFDESFSTSSSDIDFFKKADRLGYRFVFVNEAPVYEIVPKERWSALYFINRSIVVGYNSNRLYIQGTSIPKQVFMVLKAFASILLYFILFCIALLSAKKSWAIKFLSKLAYFFSQACGFFGIELIKKRNF